MTDAPGRRAVITGMGAITPLGCDVDDFWAAVTAGKSGVGVIDTFDVSTYPCRIGGLARDFDPVRALSAKMANRFERFALMAMAASEDAAKDAGLDMAKEDPARVGVVLGTGNGGISALKEYARVLIEKGWMHGDPLGLMRILPDMATSTIGSRLGATGPISTVSASCASGALALAAATDLIRSNRADVVIAGGAEAWINEMGLASFAHLRALTSNNDDPARASRPFDSTRDGFVPAEGSAMFVVEAQEHALARGARPLAEIAGYATTSDGGNLVAPRPDGASAARAISLALADAGLRPEDVDSISAHGTSTPLNDSVETKAIKLALGDEAYRIPVSALKSMIGHSLGAAAAIATVACVKSIETGILHPTINLEHPDPNCDLDYVTEGARAANVGVVLNLSYAFGGQNACLVIRRPRE